MWRYIAIGVSDDHAIRLPLTQVELADTLGLTAVHINRVLQEFRAGALITLEQGSSRCATSRGCRASPSSIRIIFSWAARRAR